MKTNLTQAIVFCVFVVLVGILFAWPSTLEKEPMGNHVWRQTDGLSIAQGYYYDDQPFFTPKMNSHHVGGGDKILTEFPIIYRVTAYLWKFTGEYPWVMRSLNLFIWISGLWYLFRLSYIVLRSHIKAWMMLLVVCSSSLLAHYSVNFIPNTSALAFLIIGIYFNYSFLVLKNTKGLFLSGLFVFLAVSLKITMLIPVLSYLFFLGIKYLSSRRRGYLIVMVPLIVQLFFVGCWVFYLKWYNGESASNTLLHNFSIYYNGWPDWQIVSAEFMRNLRTIGSPFFLITTAIISVFVLTYCVLKRKWSLLALALSLLVSLLLYMYLFFYGLLKHDYYWVILETWILLVFLVFFNCLKRNTWYINTVLIVALVFSLFQAVGNTLTRNIDEYKPYQKHIVKLVQKSDKDMNEYFRWVSSFDWNYRNYRTTFDRLKINRETPVIVFPDQSPNIPLYFFNLRGKTIFQEPNQDGLTKTFESLRSSGKDKEGYEYFIYLKGKNDAYDAEVKALSLDAIFEDSTLIVYKL